MNGGLLLIPTCYKDALPKTLSYPLGAQALSEALFDLPQAQNLSVSFWNHSAAHRYGSPYPVLIAIYNGERPSRFNSGPKWRLEVEAVGRAVKHLVKTKLCNEGLPRVHKWLRANDHSMEREGRHILTILFDELSLELRFDEYSSPEWQTERR